MATAFSPGGQSPTSLSRTIEKVFDDAQHTGEILLNGRKLKEYPKVASKYDLADTSSADLSRNRFVEIPAQICEYHSMEKLNCHHNVIRSIPQALVQLQALVHINLSRNQLTNIPPFICQLPMLEVLLAGNNRLVSLPEEIGKLERLMELDVSCNEITHLPVQIGDLLALKQLNLRRNLLVEIPAEISKLKLTQLDLSGNKISHIPHDVRKIDTLEYIRLSHNPLVTPPASICTRGKIHVMKYLKTEALKEERKRGILSEVQLRQNTRKISNLPNSVSDEFKYLESPNERRKRHTVDSGYSTTDSNEKSRWSPSEVTTDLEEANELALKAAESMKEQRQEREMELRKRIMHDSINSAGTPSPVTAHGTPSPLSHGTPSPASAHGTPTRPHNHNFTDYMDYDAEMEKVDEFTRVSVVAPSSGARGCYHADADEHSDVVTAELQRQKSEYEAKKKRAERLKREVEEEEREKEERRRAAVKIQEEQKAIIEHKKEEARRKADSSSSSLTSSSSFSEHQEINTERKIPHSQSFREEKRTSYQNNNYRRTVSESTFNSQMDSSPEYNIWRNNGVHDPSDPNTQTDPHNSNHNLPPDDEFRLRHEAMIAQQRQEAQRIRQYCGMKGQDDNLKQKQKDAVYKYFNQVSIQRGQGGKASLMEEDEFSFSRDSTPNSSFNSSTMPNMRASRNTLPPAVQKGLEAMREELTGMNPAFTIRRQLQHAQEEMQKIDQLRSNIESRLKVTLPDDLPAALRDGVVLCHLANHIRPRSVSSIHVPSPAVVRNMPVLSTPKCRRNVENFLDACRRIGVPEEQICPVSAISEEKGVMQVAITVQALLNMAAASRKSMSRQSSRQRELSSSSYPSSPHMAAHLSTSHPPASPRLTAHHSPV